MFLFRSIPTRRYGIKSTIGFPEPAATKMLVSLAVNENSASLSNLEIAGRPAG
jgi:hypothetical protein